MFWYTFLIYLTFASGQLNENFKDQYCVDPRTFKKHAANTEWADAYSCTRHKCQPSGRKLAMYTVGCKRVEKPESAIECEEVVEDTNMQFPYCCTRLRCLVVVQGEVWTKVLGQPWETLPTAPWSHMYKKKRPPPIDEKILLKAQDQQGPIYELHTEDTEEPKKATKKNILRALKSPVGKSKTNSESDVVIALTTDNGEKRVTKGHRSAGYKKVSQAYDSDSEYDSDKERATDDNDINEKKRHPWSRIPQKQWSEKETLDEADNELQSEKKVESSDLQSLVDAIDTRMRDIEDVVQRMNQNVVSKKPANVERRHDTDSEEKRERLLAEEKYQYDEKNKTDYDFYGRHKTKNNDAEYLHISEDITAEADIGNSIFKKLYTERDEEKEPMLTYIMAPVDNSRKSSKTDTFEKTKHKKHAHRSKGKGKKHKKHHDKKEAKKHSHKHSYIETDKDFLSFEDSVETPI